MEGVHGAVQIENGKILYMPAWMEAQENWGNFDAPDPWATSTTQLYPLGTKFVEGDRAFRYLYVGGVDATYTKANIGLYCAIVENASVTTGTTAAAVGATTQQIADASAVVDKYAGGFWMPRVNPYSSYRVLSNTVSDGTHVTLTLERAIITAIDAATGSCHLVENPYKDARCTWAMGRDDVSFLGITLLDTILTTYQWVQTWGPCHVVPYNEEMGAAANVQQGCFHIDGTVKDGSGSARQNMGFAIPHTGTTSTWFIMLQICP